MRHQPDFTRIKKYIGRPYEATNCFEIVREFYLGEFNLEVKQYYSGCTPKDKEVEALIQTNRGDFIRVEEPQFGDILLIKLKGVECHLGIYIQKETFLHSIKGTGSVLDKVEKYKNLIVGYYRHRGFTT